MQYVYEYIIKYSFYYFYKNRINSSRFDIRYVLQYTRAFWVLTHHSHPRKSIHRNSEWSKALAIQAWNDNQLSCAPSAVPGIPPRFPAVL